MHMSYCFLRQLPRATVGLHFGSNRASAAEPLATHLFCQELHRIALIQSIPSFPPVVKQNSAAESFSHRS